MQRRTFLTLAAAAGLAGTPVLAEQPSPVVLHGATTFVSLLLGPYRGDVEQRSGLAIVAVPTKSIHGLIALLEGRATLAMISAPLGAEMGLLRHQYPPDLLDRLESFEITRSAVAFVRHPDNAVRTLTLDALRRVLIGDLTDWRDLGGADLPIKPVFVREGGGVAMSIKARLLADADIAAPYAVRVDSPRQVIKIVAQEAGALGITQERVVALSGLPRLTADAEIEQTLTLVSLGQPSTAARAVIDAVRAVAAERKL